MKHVIIGGLLALGLASPAAAVTSGLVAFYDFESGDASDASGNGNDGTVVAGVTFGATGYAGSMGAEFTATSGLSGINTGIDINPAAMPALTMGGWFRADTINNGKVLSHDNGGFDRTLGLDTRGSVSGVDWTAFSGGGVVDADSVTQDVIAGAWQHVAVVYDGAASGLYVNGTLAESFTATNGTSIWSLFIGTNPSFNEDFIGGADDVFVFSRALSANEIGSIYSDGITITPAVPLPAGLPLLIGGLGVLGLIRRRS
ncbi:LamG domain-containing protein [Pseudooceanicola nitratireducens]|uniref:LamG domain-containing protein n=1 Tax=Pseudooceanicola nitratireducens TaxID=517719 RepID=UPI0023F4CCBD|nr:LamG domain-containing protein [Pseudooceanicola nitratireducens]